MQSEHPQTLTIPRSLLPSRQRPDAPARGDPGQQGRRLQARGRPSRLQVEERPAEEQHERLHRRLRARAHLPSGQAVRRHPRPGRHQAIHGARGARGRHQLHQGLVSPHRHVRLRPGSLGAGVAVHRAGREFFFCLGIFRIVMGAYEVFLFFGRGLSFGIFRTVKSLFLRNFDLVVIVFTGRYTL